MSHFRECPNCGHQFYIDSKTDACYPCFFCGDSVEIVPSLAEHKKQAAELAALRAECEKWRSACGGKLPPPNMTWPDVADDAGNDWGEMLVRAESAEARCKAALARLDELSGECFCDADGAILEQTQAILRGEHVK